MGVPPVNPLDDYNATFDLFYQFVKQKVGTLAADQYLQIKAIAEPLDASESFPWFSYHNYLRRIDNILANVPLTDQVTETDRQFSDEFKRFLDVALTFFESKELDPVTVDKINQKSVQLANTVNALRDLVDDDAARWERYAVIRGIAIGNSTVYAQWSATFGNATLIRDKLTLKTSLEGDLAALRDKQYANADQKEIKQAYDAVVSAGSYLRFPRRADTEYPDGRSFSLPYLFNLPPGSTVLFDDRLGIFPAVSLDTMMNGTGGSFSFKMDESSTATDSMSKDWRAGGSVSYRWFSASADSSSSTQVFSELSKTKSIEISWQSLYAIGMDASSWFKPNIFGNAIVKDNLKAFSRFFGPNGTLLYYPVSLVVMRGFKAKFKSTNNWKYDYVRNFSASGSGSLRVFGIGFGGSASYSEHEEHHEVQQNSDELTFLDGDKTLRVIGFVCGKNEALSKPFMEPLLKSYNQAMLVAKSSTK